MSTPKNIDKIFKNGLEDLNLPTTSRADQLFKEKTSKRKSLIFLFSNTYLRAAAGVCLLAGLGYVLSQFNVYDENKKVAIEQTNNKLSTGIIELKDSTLTTNKETKKTVPPISKKKLNQSKSKKNKEEIIVQPLEEIKLKNEVVKNEKVVPVNPLRDLEIDELIPDQLSKAANSLTKKENKKYEEEDGIFSNSIGETIIIVSKINPEPVPVYIDKKDKDSHLTIIQDDEPFFARLRTEYKHLKNGEKVNLNALAASEDGLIRSEAAEMKERFEWIKNKFNK